MTCPSCDRSLKAWPCDCGFAPKGHRESLKPLHQQHHYSEGISKEQFGKPLYDICFCFGEINGIQAHIQQAIDKEQPERVSDLKAKRELKHQEFSARLMRLSEPDQEALLKHYPAVVNL